MNCYLNGPFIGQWGRYTLNIHCHSLKPKAFPNQDRERGGRDGTEGDHNVGAPSPQRRKENERNVQTETNNQPDWQC